MIDAEMATVVPIALTEDEYAILLERAAAVNKTVGDYLRECALYGVPAQAVDTRNRALGAWRIVQFQGGI